MNPDNQAILAAILGTEAVQPTSTWNPGTMGGGVQAPGGAGQIGGGAQMGGAQQPVTQGPQGNPVHMGTIQSFFNGPQSTFNANPLQTPVRHSVGKDSWTSGMGLDQQTIHNNIGVGQNA